jgi:hypothetical protein
VPVTVAAGAEAPAVGLIGRASARQVEAPAGLTIDELVDRVTRTNVPIAAYDLLFWLLDRGLATIREGLVVPTDRGRELGAAL